MAASTSTSTGMEKERSAKLSRPGLEVVSGKEAPCWDEIEESEAIRKKLTCGMRETSGVRRV